MLTKSDGFFRLVSLVGNGYNRIVARKGDGSLFQIAKGIANGMSPQCISSRRHHCSATGCGRAT